MRNLDSRRARRSLRRGWSSMIVTAAGGYDDQRSVGCWATAWSALQAVRGSRALPFTSRGARVASRQLRRPALGAWPRRRDHKAFAHFDADKISARALSATFARCFPSDHGLFEACLAFRREAASIKLSPAANRCFGADAANVCHGWSDLAVGGSPESGRASPSGDAR